MYFTCLPPFTGKTVAGGPSQPVGPKAFFRCCRVRLEGGPGAIAAWFGGPIGSSLVLQKYALDGPHGFYKWFTVATAAGKGRPSVSKLCYTTGGVSQSTDDAYRLQVVQVAAPKPVRGHRPLARSDPWVVWIDKVSYLGTSAELHPDTWSPGRYPICP